MCICLDVEPISSGHPVHDKTFLKADKLMLKSVHFDRTTVKISVLCFLAYASGLDTYNALLGKCFLLTQKY